MLLPTFASVPMARLLKVGHSHKPIGNRLFPIGLWEQTVPNWLMGTDHSQSSYGNNELASLFPSIVWEYYLQLAAFYFISLYNVLMAELQLTVSFNVISILHE